MTQNAAELLAQVLRLPETERGEFAEHVLESLSPSDVVDIEWDQEIQQRIHDLDSGKVQPVPWPDARRLILEDGNDD
jgi:putative addiction module component (TIGR02574 family)